LDTYSQGKAGEEVACKYLKELGHEIVTTNFRKRNGEIDIISRLGNVLYFIEVKNWKNEVPHPLESLTKKKCERMRSVARIFLYELGWNESEFTISFSLLHVRNDSISFYTDLF